MSKVEIGSKYDGPCFDKPCLRQMPRHWVLEEAELNRRLSWWQRTDRWVVIIIALLLLIACAQAALRALT